MSREEFLEPLYKIINKDYIKKIRIIDPRVHGYNFYVKVSDSDAEKILKAYPNSKIEYNICKKIKSISSPIMWGTHFMIYNVSGFKRTRMIKAHDRKYKKEKEEAKKVVF